MDAIEKRARELLAAQFDANGPCAKVAATAKDTFTAGAVRAISAALTPPEGYVLVPVEPTEVMHRAGAGIVCTDVEEIRQTWAAMLAARPEVKR